MDELVSVIIPTYNRSNLLVEAIDSVLSQTYRNFEVIVVDDGSTEDIEGLLKRYPDNVRYVRIPHSGHPSVGRNTGISVARGELIAFLDNDDRWVPEKLEEQVKILKDNPGIGLVSSNAFIVRDNEVVQGITFLSIYSGVKGDVAISGNVWRSLVFDNFIVTSTVLIRKALLDTTGVFSTSKNQRITQDYDLWLRVTAITDIYYIPENLAYYRADGGLHNSETPAVYYESMLEVFGDLKKYLKKIGKDRESINLADRRVYEFKSYLSINNRELANSFSNLFRWLVYRLLTSIS